MKTQSKIARDLFGNWVPKVLAFLTALFIVVAVRFFNITDRTVTIALDVKLRENSNIIPVSLVPSTIDVVITGRDDIIYLVDPTQITASVDFSDVDDSGIARRSIDLVYDHDIFTANSLTVQAKPASVRILFEQVGAGN